MELHCKPKKLQLVDANSLNKRLMERLVTGKASLLSC